VPAEHVRILDTHLAYLKDSVFLSDVENLILNEQMGLESSIGKVIADFDRIFRLVQNETGLAGHFDLDVTWPPDSRPPWPQAAGVGPATFTAIEEQLGLKVEERTGNVEVFVIEDIQRRP